jgi:hypothetical protein
MTSRTKKISKKTKGKVRVDEILRRVDRLPELNSFTADEILGYDRNGLSQSESSERAAEPSVPEAKRVSNAVEDFLKYRHRDWEA